MSDEFNVFISWSGPRSEWVAKALHEWLPLLIQSAKPWMSATDIDKGARGLEEISNQLAGMKVGIVCLTPENQNAPWILYEAGALSKTVGEKTRLCTYLLGGLRPQDVPPPLSMFQATVPNGADTRNLLGAINRAVSTSPLSDARLDRLFEKCWPDIQKALDEMPQIEEAAEPRRALDDMVAEILDIARAGANDTEKLHAQMAQLARILKRSLSGGVQLSTLAPGRAGRVLSGLTAEAALRGAHVPSPRRYFRQPETVRAEASAGGPDPSEPEAASEEGEAD